MLRENDPELAAELIPAANEAAKKAFETIWNLLKNGKTVGESEAFQLASFGDAASSYAPVLQKQMVETGETAMQNPWLIGALACMASDPKPYLSTLLESMRNVEAPLLRVLSILGEEGHNQLGVLRKNFPSQVDELLKDAHT
jgi:hypothetical protein